MITVETDIENETVVGVNRTIKIKKVLIEEHTQEYAGYVSVRGVSKQDLVVAGGFFLRTSTLDKICLRWLRERGALPE